MVSLSWQGDRVVMDNTMTRCFRLEGSSWRKVGRSNSSLLASELVGSEVAKVAAYERLSESMRVTIADDYSGGGYCRSSRSKTRGWSFLVKAFSFRKRDTGAAPDDVYSGQVVVVEEAAVKLPEAVVQVAAKRKMKSVWFPNPHRRWPLQGW